MSNCIDIPNIGYESCKQFDGQAEVKRFIKAYKKRLTYMQIKLIKGFVRNFDTLNYIDILVSDGINEKPYEAVFGFGQHDAKAELRIIF